MKFTFPIHASTQKIGRQEYGRELDRTYHEYRCFFVGALMYYKILDFVVEKQIA